MSSELFVIDPAPAGGAEPVAKSGWSGWSDWAGMVASVGCAIHCAAMPFVIAYLPALGLSFLADEAFHQWMAVGCFAIALTAFVPGLRKHGRLTPVIIGSVGLVMISVAAFGFAGECCAACEEATTASTVAPTDPASGVNATASSDDCTEACCPHCAADESSTGESDTAEQTPPSSSSQLVATLVPWMTPLGGIVLVSAHLLNRRFGCSCGCCEDETAAVTA
ncbi:MerC family mercury resistance protein [Crateriforma spongiae]|uniref:MerC family mercury resistance protein n=1 Tax=Crateriforma spongiae TaxID=2724528 RepID=UPI0039AF155D